MHRYLALDQSKSRTGYAFWEEGMSRPVLGHFRLGDEFTPPGKVFARMHMELDNLQSVLGFNVVRYEQPADPSKFDRQTPFAIPFVLIGIAAHINSFCTAREVACDWVPAATWRRHFIGSMKRGTQKAALKDFVKERCKQLGMAPKNDDEADACGILDYTLANSGVHMPWRDAHLFGGAMREAVG